MARPNRARWVAMIVWGVLVAILTATLGPAALTAAPLPQAAGPAIVVQPRTAAQGELVRVLASGFSVTSLDIATACLGLLGPGQNPEQGIAPTFRLRLGVLTLSASGTGSAEVRLPAQLPTGDYRVTIGACPPQPDLAPLASQAQAALTVSVARDGPTGLPATGGTGRALPTEAVVLGVLGSLLVAAAVSIRRRAVS